MSWTIGKVEFPVPPQRIVTKAGASLKKINVGIEAPWLYHMGPDVKQLSLEGMFISSPGKRVTGTLYPSYVRPFERYCEKHMAIAMPLMDIAPTGVWKSGAGVTTFKGTGDRYVKNNESLYVVFGANDRNIYQDFDSDVNFKEYNLVNIWVRGTGSEKFALTFYNEPYATRTNGYRQYIQASGNGNWYQRTFTMSSIDGSPVFNNVGTSTGWDKIRSIVIDPSGTAFNPGAQGYNFDVLAIGIGWKVTSPGKRQDGIYLLQSFQWEETKGDITSLSYRIQMMDQSEFYGLKQRAV